MLRDLKNVLDGTKYIGVILMTGERVHLYPCRVGLHVPPIAVA